MATGSAGEGGAGETEIPPPAPEGEDAEGTIIAVTWGEEVFSPVQYQSFRSGSMTVTTKVQPGETRGDAHARILTELRSCAAEQFKVQLSDFLERVKQASAAARGR